MVHLLLECGAIVHSVGPAPRWSESSREACSQGQGSHEVVQILLAVGANVDDCDENQQTALYFVARNGRVDFVKLLVDYGANVQATTTSGITTLMITCGITTLMITCNRGGPTLGGYCWPLVPTRKPVMKSD